MAHVNMNQLADELYEAETSRKGIAPLTANQSNLSIEEAYKIQMINIERKQQLGHKISGKKVGLTSLAMQNLLGVDQPDFGYLLDSMAFDNGDQIDFTKVMQPKVEGEIAFVLNRDLAGPNVTKEDVLAVTEYVMPAIEVVDSRVKDWKITLADTVADNASCGLYVLGDKFTNIEQIDLASIHMKLYKNDELINDGYGNAVLDHPANAVAWLANKLYDFGVSLKANEIILSGAFSAAVDAEPGDCFTISMSGLSDVGFCFSRE